VSLEVREKILLTISNKYKQWQSIYYAKRGDSDMAIYEIGNLIRDLRTARGLSQEKLSEGICSPQTLSRAESGTTILTYPNLTAIMQKLGASTNDYFDSFMSAQEYECYKKRNEVNSLLDKRKLNEVELLLREMSEDIQFQTGLNRQFYLSSFAFYKLCMAGDPMNNESLTPILNLLQEAIRITIKKFDMDKIREYLLTLEEMKIINRLALAYLHSGDVDMGIKLLYELKFNMETLYKDHAEKMELYTMVLYNLSVYLGKQDRHVDVIDICDFGIKVCRETKVLSVLPFLIFNKAYAYYEIGQKELCLPLLKQSYYGLYIIENYQKAEIIKHYTKDKFGIEL
jgi:transcriptional regulator with XRE-family HTH domain